MNKLISFVVILSLFSSLASAECDWTKIIKNSDGTYTYPEQVHLCVGQMIQDSKSKDQQIVDLNSAITLKDVALQKSDQRVQLWTDTSGKLEDRLNKVDDMRSKNEWIFFSLGMAGAIGAGFMASRLIGSH